MIQMKEIGKRQRRELLARVRIVVANELHQIIKVRQEWTGKEIAQNLGLDPARISEIMAATPKPFAEQTLRKLIGGGVVKVQDILNKVNPTPEEADYLRRFRAYEDKSIVSEIDDLSQAGVDVAAVLKKIRQLNTAGVNPKDALDVLLKKLSTKK